MENYNLCTLKLNHLIFDELSFQRLGFQNQNELDFEFGFNFENADDVNFITHLRVVCTKKDEYTLTVRASGYFALGLDVPNRKQLIQENTVAIIFPYIRSQISILTAQPEVEPVLLPAMNISKIVSDVLANENQ